MTTYIASAQTAANSLAGMVEPFTPQVVKDSVQYGIKTATPIVNGTLDYASKTAQGTVDYANKTVSGTVDYAQKTAQGTVDYANKTVSGTVNYANKTVTGTVEYAQKTAQGTVDYANKTVSGTVDYGKNVINSATTYASTQANNASSYASTQASQALEFGKVVVNGATTTITSHTPGPVLTLIQSTVDGANALRQDPRPYVPTFVIHIGEKTYEIVAQVQEQSVEGIKAASGFIVTKVNGTTQYVTSVPLIANIIERLQSITAPIISRFGKKGEDGTVSVDATDALIGESTENSETALKAEKFEQ